MSHLPDAAIWGRAAPHRAALDCYDSAIAYTSATLVDAMRVVNQAPRPTLLIYVPNRGEDAWGQPGRYGASRGARETDVPLLVYANAGFAQRYWQTLANARRNRDRPVASAWVFDAVLDAFGVATAGAAQGDRRLSVLDASYDPRAADSATLAATGVASELARRARLEAESGGRFCTHRGNTLLKYLEGKAAVRLRGDGRRARHERARRRTGVRVPSARRRIRGSRSTTCSPRRRSSARALARRQEPHRAERAWPSSRD